MSIKLTITDDQLAAAFSSLKTFGDIADLLEVRPSTLGYYLRPRSNNYKVFSLDKRTGGRRTIYSPVTPLKIIQRKLNQVLHAVYKGRSPAHGCVRGKSIVTNARGHLRKRIILNFDLEDFFPSIHFGRVKGMFEAKPYNLPPSVAVTLARICCHKAVLPAGAPTSPTVANMLCAQLDAQLKRLALASGCIYTRYVDDITFSTIHDRFSPAILYRDQTAKIWIIGDELKRIVSANGFRIHPTKTRVLPRTYRQEVTGLIVSDSLNVKRRFVRQVRAMLHALERWGLEAASDYFHGKFDRKQRANKKTDFARVLRGKIEFIGFVRGRDDPIYIGLMRRYLTLAPAARMRPVIATERAKDSVLQQAVWLIEQKDGPDQGTAFAAEKLGLLTAAHVVRNPTEVRQPKLDPSRYDVTILRRDDNYDIAQIGIGGRSRVLLRIGSSDGLKTGDRVKVLGFPRYREGDDVCVVQACVVQSKVIHGITHFSIEPPIISGNSGGPVLDHQNRLVGIAVKGQGESGRFTSEDEVSCFVPISAIEVLDHD